MPNERKYIYLEKIMKEVPILAEAGTYTWKIGDVSFKIDAAIERMLVYELYACHTDNNFFELAKANLPKKVSANISPLLIKSSFIEEHPCFDLKEYDYSIIPEYADPEKGMWLHGDGKSWSFWIAKEDEQILLSQLNDNMPWKSGKSYLRSVAERYAMKLDEVSIIQSLACFYKQHGIDPNSLREKDRFYKTKLQKEIQSENTEVREYARNEWLKYHSEDKDKNVDGLSRSYEPQRKKDDKSSGGNVSSAVAGIICALVVTGLWIALFCKVDIFVLILPVVSAMMYIAAGNYIKKCEEFDGICYFFLIFFVVNLITSIVAFCIDASGEMGIATALNLILPAFLLGRGNQ